MGHTRNAIKAPIKEVDTLQAATAVMHCNAMGTMRKPLRFLTRRTVHTAIGQERGYWIHVAEFTVLEVTTPDFGLRSRGVENQR